MQYQQLIGPLGGALIALLGVGLTLSIGAVQKRRDRRHEYAIGLVKQRHELYVDYLNALDIDLDLAMNTAALQFNPSEQVERLESLELRMRLFAVEHVIGVFEKYLEIMTELANQQYMIGSVQRFKLCGALSAAEAVSITMMRADLDVDSFDSRWRQIRRRKNAARLIERGARKASERRPPSRLWKQIDEFGPDLFQATLKTMKDDTK